MVQGGLAGLAWLAARGLVAVTVVLPVGTADGSDGSARRPAIADVGVFAAALVSALVSALVAERALLVDAAAPFSIVLGAFVLFVRGDSFPGKRVGHDGSH